MKTYQSCGTLDVANKTVNVLTFLPEQNINFRFIHFYNISTSSHYGIMGILVNDGLNEDLSNTTPIRTSIPGMIELKNIDYIFSKIKFDDLTVEDEVTFICFHDDEFNPVKPGNDEVLALQYWQQMLPLFGKPRIDSLHEIERKIAELKSGPEGEPKVGNGGVLTITGCP